MDKHIIAIAGSLRNDSYNKALIRAAQELAPQGITIEMVDISNLPLFNEDLESNFPTEVQELKGKIEKADGVLFATPEYNRSIPGVLKNAIDWMSRPYGKNSFAGMSVLITGASMGMIGTALAQSHLKQVMLYLDAHVIGQPEFYLASAHEKFDSEGRLVDENTRTHLREALEAFAARIT